MRNTVTERHNIACRMILKEVSEGSYGANFVHVDAGSSGRLAQDDLYVPEHEKKRKRIEKPTPKGVTLLA